MGESLEHFVALLRSDRPTSAAVLDAAERVLRSDRRGSRHHTSDGNGGDDALQHALARQGGARMPLLCGGGNGVIDSTSFGWQWPDISYGRFPDGSAAIWFAHP